MIESLILFATLGIFAGLIAGMFGVGGGIITVPVLVACFIQYGFEDAIMIHMAVGTSLGCIVFTGISSAYAHRQKNAINYKFFKPIALGIVIGAFLGALFAVQLNGNILKIIIGIFALFVAIQMGINREIEFKKRAERNKEPYFVGTGIGFAIYFRHRRRNFFCALLKSFWINYDIKYWNFCCMWNSNSHLWCIGLYNFRY